MKGALVAVFALLLFAGCGTEEKRTPRAQKAEKISGLPGPLAALNRQADRLLGGGESAFRKRLLELRGYPVVVNKWASWCGPCKFEFPFFLAASRHFSKRVAFLGLNAQDTESSARAFLKKNSGGFPSYIDREQKIAATIDAAAGFPTTVFLSKKGGVVAVHPGGYSSKKALFEDIERYSK